MTRSHKLNDKDHAGLANGTAAPEEHLPRYFAKHGHVGEDPKKVKKSGGGKGNWLVFSFTTVITIPSMVAMGLEASIRHHPTTPWSDAARFINRAAEMPGDL